MISKNGVGHCGLYRDSESDSELAEPGPPGLAGSSCAAVGEANVTTVMDDSDVRTRRPSLPGRVSAPGHHRMVTLAEGLRWLRWVMFMVAPTRKRS